MLNSSQSQKIIYPELSYRFMKLVYEIHNRLGPGFTENIYEEALAYELEAHQIPFERQKPIQVIYKGKDLGLYKLDLDIDGKIIVELKAVSELNDLFKAQLLSYLKATGLKLGILINFGSLKAQQYRVVC
jgi:GxxExxY protein